LSTQYLSYFFEGVILTRGFLREAIRPVRRCHCFHRLPDGDDPSLWHDGMCHCPKSFGSGLYGPDGDKDMDSSLQGP
jgi:hypothetical protein